MLLMQEERVRTKEETTQKQLKITIWHWKKIKKDLLRLEEAGSLSSEI
jgi:hypothetical protein